MGMTAIAVAIGPACLKFDPNGITFSVGPVRIKIVFSGALVIELGGLNIKIDANGFKLNCASL